MPSARSGFAPLVIIAVIVGGRRRLRLYGRLVLARPSDPRQAGRRPGVRQGPFPRPPPQPCQGHLLHGRVRSQRRRVGVVPGPGLRPAAATPSLGRFNLATPDADAPDATVRVRGLGLRISTPDGQEWRTAMIDAPVFPDVDAAGLLRIPARLREQGPERGPGGGRRPSRARTQFRAWATSAPWTVQLCAGPVQQPQQLPVRRQCRRRACRAMVAGSHWRTPECRSRRPTSPSVAPTILEQEIAERRARGAAALDPGR